MLQSIQAVLYRRISLKRDHLKHLGVGLHPHMMTGPQLVIKHIKGAKPIREVKKRQSFALLNRQEIQKEGFFIGKLIKTVTKQKRGLQALEKKLGTDG